MSDAISKTEIKAQKRAFRMNYMKSLFVSIDQLANAIAFGNPDNTISARVGKQVFRKNQERKPKVHWRLFRWCIDRTFYPIDGPNHCKEAYQNDNGEFFYDTTSLLAVLMMGLFIILACIPISIILHFLWCFGIVAPKFINRNYNIQRKINLTVANLQGAKNELNSNTFIVYPSLPPLMNPIISIAKDLQNDLLNRT